MRDILLIMLASIITAALLICVGIKEIDKTLEISVPISDTIDVKFLKEISIPAHE